MRLFLGPLQTMRYALGLGVVVLGFFVLDFALAQGALLVVVVSVRRRTRSSAKPRVLGLLHFAQNMTALVGPLAVTLAFIAVPDLVIDVLQHAPLLFPTSLSFLHLLSTLVLPGFVRRALGAVEYEDPAWHDATNRTSHGRAWVRPWVIEGTGTLNAVAVGLIRPQVFVTSDLVDELGEKQRLAVYLHEIGHIERRHGWRMLGWSFVLASAAAILIMVLRDRIPEPGVVVVVVVAYVAAFLGFPALSRRYELEADAFAAERASAHEVAAALREIDARNGEVENVSMLRLHPSVRERCRALGWECDGTQCGHDASTAPCGP
ncbi:M48 family metallopeptidase [Limnochorda pilosa]|uniref:M48 family metallopeptidase n=1 Tax=Limnochorda pilosa TaxID=1555112 RepID=UPI00130E2665|nr:M48 family metalloprotease [Limnochorda pilosa]